MGFIYSDSNYEDFPTMSVPWP